MKEQLLHILDQSVCLTRKQMREYLSGTMPPEVAHAAEFHLNACPLCHLAMEGFEQHSDEALEAIAALNSGFLKEHFDNISPQIHLNSMAPAAAMPASHATRTRRLPASWRIGSVAAGVLLLFGLVWALERRQSGEALPPPFPNVSKQGATHGTAGASTQKPALPHTQSMPANASGEAAYVMRPEPAVSAAIHEQGQPTTAPQLETAASSVPVSTPAVKTPPTSAEAAGSHYYQEYDAASNGSESQPGSRASETKKAATAPTPSSDRAKSGHRPESYSEGSIEASLRVNLHGMKSTDPTTRYQSMIGAAQCYDALGQRTKAEDLLQKVIDEAPGHERRQARRALRRLR
jgi:hypothetical protein